MPKSKPKKAAVKRFTLTATGKVRRKSAYHSHILTKKSPKRKRNLTKPAFVSKSDMNRITDCLN